jgi:parvulin-like peptidyl-prolyl isomerase
MTPAPRRPSRAAWAVALASHLLLCPAAVRAAIVEEVVATVSGDAITKSELDERETEIKSQLFARFSGDELDRAVEQARKTLLVDLINEKLLYQRAERLGLDLEQVYNSSVENVKRQNNIQTEAELQEEVKRQGMTMEEFRETLLRYNVPEIMINIEVREKIGITDAEAEEYYKDHKDKFSHPATYTFRQIGLRLESRSRDEAVKLAEKIAGEAAAGADFTALVTQYSEDPTKETGGLIESLPAPDMSAAILEALAKLEPGELSKPIATSLAVLVLRLESRTEATTDAFWDARPKIDALLQRVKFQGELQSFLKKLWKDNHVVVSPKYAEKYPTDAYR